MDECKVRFTERNGRGKKKAGNERVKIETK